MRRRTGPVSDRSPNTPALGAVTMAGGALVGAYGVVNAWAVLTSGQVLLLLSPPQFDDVVTVPWAPGAKLVAPYSLSAPDAAVSAAARSTIQVGQLLTPLLWAAVMLALGALLVRVGRSESLFSPPVFRALDTVIGLLFAVALVPTGLVLFGTNLAVRDLAWPMTARADFAGTWLPLLAAYLGLAFRAALRHGARLADELAQVI